MTSNPLQAEMNQALAVFMVAILAGLVLAVVWAARRKPNYYNIKRKLKVAHEDTPVLLGIASRHGDLVLLRDGYTPMENRYAYIMGLGIIYSHTPVYGLYSIELPFVAATHLLGMSKHDGLPVKVKTDKSALEPVALEGNYADYFSLYVDKNEQMEARYILDPKAMVFTMDFCSKYNWEIVGSTLFFLSDNEVPSYELVDQFIKEIRPAIDTGAKPVRHSHDLPYVTIQPLHMDCPICSVRMQPAESWLACVKQHGILVTGRQLIRLRSAANPKLLTTALKTKDQITGRVLTCPYCKSPMKETAYQNTNIGVDVCTSCRHRWLDYKELDEIVGIEKALG